MNYKFTKQKSENDCGIAVSTMIINYFHNKSFSLEEIKLVNGLQDEMMSFYNIQKLLKSYKIDFESYKSAFNEFSEIEINQPIIISILNKFDQEHFIIIYKKINNKILVADPLNNDLEWLNIKEFEKTYQGYFGLLKKEQKLIFKDSNFKKWLNFIIKFKKSIYLIICLGVFLNLFIILNNGFLKVFLKNIKINDNFYQLKIISIFIFLFLFQLIIEYFLQQVIFKVKEKINKDIFYFYQNKLVNLEIENFKSLEKQEWVKKIEHINLISTTLTQISIKIPIEFILFIFSLITLSIISPILLFLVLIENILICLITFLNSYFLKEHELKFEQEMKNFGTKYNQLLEGYEEIKYKDLTLYISNDINQQFNKCIKSSKNSFFIKQKNNYLLNLLSKIFYFLTFYIFYILISKNAFEINSIFFYVSISTYISKFSNSLMNLILNIEQYKIASHSLQFIFNDIPEKEETNKISNLNQIEFKNVFKYTNEICQLNDINYTFTKNTFIYGKSGSGKTTLLKLLSGNFSKFEGNILINNIDFKKINLESYKDKIIYLGQYDYLFDGTVWENLQQFKNKIDLKVLEEQKLLDVLKHNNIDLNKKIINNGQNLSKGQRQIINFISLFFTNKQLYLIDEPLSNVDKPTAYFLFKQFLEYKKQSLIIMVDHDLVYKNFFDSRLEVL